MLNTREKTSLHRMGIISDSKIEDIRNNIQERVKQYRNIKTILNFKAIQNVTLWIQDDVSKMFNSKISKKELIVKATS